MESVRNARRKLRKHFKEVDEPFYGWSRLETHEIVEIEKKHLHPRRYRYSLEDRTIPLMKNSHWDAGASWNFDWDIRPVST